MNINGENITDNSEILKHEVNFYKKLYTSDNIDNNSIEMYLNNTQFDQILSNEEASCCEGLLTLNEGKQAILEMKTNKAPGLTGLTIEFYQTFWNKIGDLVINSLNVGYMKGELSHLQKQSVFSLLYKKGDPENLENWRPISLLNTDYKIGTRILAKRMQLILPKLISMDQQGYIKNRNICFNIRQIQDIIDYA